MCVYISDGGECHSVHVSVLVEARSLSCACVGRLSYLSFKIRQFVRASRPTFLYIFFLGKPWEGGGKVGTGVPSASTAFSGGMSVGGGVGGRRKEADARFTEVRSNRQGVPKMHIASLASCLRIRFMQTGRTNRDFPTRSAVISSTTASQPPCPQIQTHPAMWFSFFACSVAVEFLRGRTSLRWPWT